MFKIRKDQMENMGTIFLEVYIKNLFERLCAEFPEVSLKSDLTEKLLTEWVVEARKYAITSEDCVSDYCRVKLLNLEHFSKKNHMRILNNILLNDELSQDRKIVFIEKYLYDDINSITTD